MKYFRKKIVYIFSSPLIFIFLSLLAFSELPQLHNMKKDYIFHDIEEYIKLEGFHNHELHPSSVCFDSHKLTGEETGHCNTCLIISNLNSLFAAFYNKKHYNYHTSYIYPNLQNLLNLTFRKSFSSRAPPFC